MVWIKDLWLLLLCKRPIPLVKLNEYYVMQQRCLLCFCAALLKIIVSVVVFCLRDTLVA